MENRESLLANCKNYLACYLEEEQRLQTFISYLDRTASKDLYTRKNFDGHITASVFILDESCTKLLMLHHKILNRWLQPGGHVDLTDKDLLSAAYRECVEETGIKAENLRLFHNSHDESIPFDIDSHRIPENLKKQEEAHFHHDIRYLFIYTGSKEISINVSESEGFQWRDLSDIEKQEGFELVVSKVRLLITEQAVK